MSLLELQTAFRDEIAAADDGIAPGSPGMEIYRNAYRSRLLGALESSFGRTRRWAGEDGFTAAACHYILENAPVSWTLDDYGIDFPALLQRLFADDPEVAELAWLEWHLSRAFAAPDMAELGPQAMASAGLSDEDWQHLKFTMAAGFAVRPIASNCTSLWLAMTAESDVDFAVEAVEGTWLVVWRRGLEPHFRILNAREYGALAVLADGGTLGRLAADADPEALGGWLACWLGEGLFSSLRVQNS